MAKQKPITAERIDEAETFALGRLAGGELATHGDLAMAILDLVPLAREALILRAQLATIRRVLGWPDATVKPPVRCGCVTPLRSTVGRVPACARCGGVLADAEALPHPSLAVPALISPRLTCGCPVPERVEGASACGGCGFPLRGDTAGGYEAHEEARTVAQ